MWTHAQVSTLHGQVAMTPDELKPYVEFMKRYGLTFLEVRRGDFHLRLCTGDDVPPPSPATEVVPSVAPASPSAGSPAPKEGEKSSRLIAVTAPLVGTFYRAPSPESSPFVEVGSAVRKGDTLCIIEAMKVMNEVKAEQDGVVREILVENGKPVEYGQPLFVIDTGSR